MPGPIFLTYSADEPGSFVFAATEPRPITNLPAECLRYRVRFRTGDLPRIYLRFPDRVEEWLVTHGPARTWQLALRTGLNGAYTP